MTDLGKYRNGLEAIWSVDLDSFQENIKSISMSDPRACLLEAEASWFLGCITEKPIDCDTAFQKLQQTMKAGAHIADQYSKIVKSLKKSKGIQTPCTTPKFTPNSELSKEDQKRTEELQRALEEEEMKNELNDVIEDKEDVGGLPEVDPSDEVGSLLMYLSGRSVVAEALLLDSLLKFKMQKFVKGVYSFRKSWKIFQDMLKLLTLLPETIPEDKQELHNNAINSANFGTGFFHFIVSIIPPQFNWLVEGIGFKGNQVLGLQELTTAVQTPGYRAIISAFCLVWVYSFYLDQFQLGEKILLEWLEKLPKASFFLYLAGSIYRKQGNVSLSTEYFEKALETSSQIKQYQLYCEFEIGYNHYLQRNWPLALPKLKRFAEESPTAGFKAYAMYQLAMCNAMSFQMDQAKEMMKQLLSYVRKNFTYDEYAERHAKHFLDCKDGLSNFDRKFLITFLQHETHEYEDVLDGIETIQMLATNDVEKAQVQWLKGAATYGLKKYDEAIEILEQVFPYKKKVEKSPFLFVLPFSHTVLGEIYLSRKKLDKASEQFKKAKQYSSYDFDALLLWRIRKGQEQVAAQK